MLEVLSRFDRRGPTEPLFYIHRKKKIWKKIMSTVEFFKSYWKSKPNWKIAYVHAKNRKIQKKNVFFLKFQIALKFFLEKIYTRLIYEKYSLRSVLLRERGFKLKKLIFWVVSSYLVNTAFHNSSQNPLSRCTQKARNGAQVHAKKAYFAISFYRLWDTYIKCLWY